MRGRKAIAGVVLFLFLLSMAAPAGAAPFKDLDSSHWAYKDISKMYAKGVVAGYGEEYRPSESISREQAVVMLVRILGLAGEAEGKTLPVTFRNPEAVSKDFRSIIALAVEKGIVVGQDVFDFRPREPAKRYEIAVFIARAMGFNATTGSTANLPFTDSKELNDWAPWAAPYVYYVYDQGIMSGDTSGAFRPLDQLTRAEMAALLSRVDAKVMKPAANTFRGEAYSISPAANSILVQDGMGQIVTVPVAPEAAIYKENKAVALADLQRGDKLEIVKNAQGQGVYLEVIPAGAFVYDESQVKGTVEAIQGVGVISLTVRTTAGVSTSYTLAGDVEVTVDGLAGQIDDLLVGQEVDLLVRGNNVVEVVARNVDREVSGELVSVNTGLYPTVSVKDSTGIRTTYSVDSQTRIELDGALAELEDLVQGQEVRAIVSGQKVSRLWATSFTGEVEGTLVRAEFAPVERVILKVETAKGQFSEQAYEMEQDARIRRDGSRATLRDLVPGDEIEAELTNGKVSALYAKRVELSTEGRVVAVTLAYTPSLTIMDSKGQQTTYTIAPDARLRRDRARIDVTDLKVDDYVSIRVEGQTIVDLRAEDRIVNDYLIGTIGEINTKAQVLVLDDPEEQTRFNVGIYVDDRYTRIIKLGDDIDFEDLAVGDRIIVVGKAESYRFLADTILVISAAR
ncbi:MAG: S-layer homology domain-containing protein [Clostridia bacterium]|nr:S-layer homology domain-containing protein [Clostridia bacterium]